MNDKPLPKTINAKKPLPIGLSDFKKVIDGDYAYVDKTLLIQELIERGTHVTLIPRPRRFGKTLNLSMLRYFFEKTDTDTSYLFHNTKIWNIDRYRALQGQFPVVFISLKDKHSSLEKSLKSMRGLLAREFEHHAYLVQDGCLTAREKKFYQKILDEEDDQLLLEDSLLLLTEWLYRYHKMNVILLVDEYDAPAHAAYLGNYYGSMIEILKNFLSKGFKDNIYLERGVLTGILRVAKESIFSGANNIKTYSILHDTFSDKFGLLESEVEVFLQNYNLTEKLPEIRKWYDGYQMGCTPGIYNPWSVLNCVQENGAIALHWVNSSDNEIMKRLITRGSEDLKADVEDLLRGGSVEKLLEEGIVFTNLEQNPNAIWSLLAYSGYLTIKNTTSYGAPCSLAIPNIEVTELYKTMILGWFESTLQEYKYSLLLKSLTSGDVDSFSQIFKEFMLNSVSVFDVPAEDSEKIYHAFVLGMLIGLKDQYEVKSNRESGLGRYDVMLIPRNKNDLGIIMEFKKVGRFEKTDLEKAVTSALRQIEEKQYAIELLERGIKHILYLGFAFEGKEVLIRSKFRK
ncbi:MAG: AAA family ATPase [Verrucomicrobiota bacterium]|nr:AAA family ATPase [Verrucomicrobiota bacterium]